MAPRLKFIKPAKRAVLPALIVDQLRELLEGGEALLLNGVLQFADRLRIEQVILAADAVLIRAAGFEFRVRFGDRPEREIVLHLRFARKNIEADAFDARGRAGEVLLNQRFVQADGFEDLGAAIALQRRDAHLREDLQQSLVDRLLVFLERLLKA